jgi:alpha/beta superfamily hydrolase
MTKYFSLILLFLCSTLSSSQNIVGSWIGEVNANNNKIAFAFHIKKVGEQFESTMDIPKSGLSDAKAENTTFIDKMLTISFPNFGIEYIGTLNADNEIIGNLFKDGLPTVLNLKKGEITLNRPQEPKPPFDYESEDVTFINTIDNLKLAGTLTLPKKKGKHPVVIIISGSGPQNRDGDMFGHKPYYVLADQLTSNGIGVLRFDERGVGVSEGNFETASIKELSTDVTSAITYLKSRNDINVSKIGLIGHSIGGIIAPKVATESNDISYIVLLAAPGVNGDELMLSQKAAMERIMGFNEIQIAQSSTLVKGAYNIIVNSNLDNTSLKDSLNSHYINIYGKMIPDNQRKSLVDQITNYEVVSLIKSKPSEYLEQVKCPVLALNGSKDFQVPATENLKAIKNAIEKNGNKNVRTVTFENLNHLFQECKTGASSEYSEIEETMSFGVLDLVTAWIKEQTD